MRRIRPCLTAAVLVAGLTACSDAPLPFEPPAAAAGMSATAAYESRERLKITGGEVYLVGVYFDQTQYLVQVGVRRGGSAARALRQGAYTTIAGELSFEGGLLEAGHLSDDGAVLRTTLLLDGERVPLRLSRRAGAP